LQALPKIDVTGPEQDCFQQAFQWLLKHAHLCFLLAVMLVAPYKLNSLELDASSIEEVKRKPVLV
jgi:hypothetical protein